MSSLANKTLYIEKFKVLYKELYDVELTEQLAIEYFEQIHTLLMAVCKPLPNLVIANK
ncbi:MAG TPA: hypothetical protein VGE63_00205 [Candidatus Paceibacterota bacterium]